MEHPKRDQNPKFYTPKRDHEHPRLFHMEVPPGSWRPITSIIGLNPVLIYEKKTYRFIKTYSQICALNSCDKRHSEKLTVNRQMN